jgi:hypothetical protein
LEVFLIILNSVWDNLIVGDFVSLSVDDVVVIGLHDVLIANVDGHRQLRLRLRLGLMT